MEEENQVFDIPIGEFLEDMNTEFSRDKQKEITELLTKHNQLRSIQEYSEIKHKLHLACKKGDI